MDNWQTMKRKSAYTCHVGKQEKNNSKEAAGPRDHCDQYQTPSGKVSMKSYSGINLF